MTKLSLAQEAKVIGWHFHRWTKWSDKYTRGSYWYQYKTCLKCNKIKDRMV